MGFNNHIKTIIILSISFLSWIKAEAQPVLFQKTIIESVSIYPDLKDSTLYYYEPGALSLKNEGRGKPEFQMLQMRYTGTKLASTSSEKRFTNIVQFSVMMHQIKAPKLKVVKEKLGSNIRLSPLPIKNVEAQIILPAAAVDGDNEIMLDGISSSQSTGKKGNTGKSSYWTERTFTLKLDNFGAQLLWSLLEEKKLAISVSYAFTADMINNYRGEIITSEDSAFLKLTDNIENNLGIDSLVTSPVIVNAGSFSIELDVETYTGLLKKIDINEALPPVYPTIEIRCYDFLENLRPDLAMKKVLLKATSVTGRKIELPPVKFAKGQPDLHTHQVASNYAITLSKPLSYKVISITEEGNVEEADWVNLDVWSGLIDVTTPNNELLLKHKNITFELGIEDIKDLNISEVKLYVEYYQHQAKIANTVSLYPSDEQFYDVDIKFDKDTDIRYQLIWWSDSEKNVSRKKRVHDEYVYLRFKD